MFGSGLLGIMFIKELFLMEIMSTLAFCSPACLSTWISSSLGF